MSALQRCGSPVTLEEYQDWFDCDGRLVKEASMRQRVFEGGVDPSCRRSLWKFLFGIHPLNSTHRDRKTIDIENRANYLALRERWEVLDKTITIPDDDLMQAPPYMELSDDDEEDVEDCPPNRRMRTKRGSEPTECHSTRSKVNSEQFPVMRTKSASVGVQSGYHGNRDGFVDPRTMNSIPTYGNSTNTGSHMTSGSTHIDSHMTPGSTHDTESHMIPGPTHSTESHNGGNSKGTPTSDARESEGEGNMSVCSCDFRRHSNEEVMDEGGRALLKILEFPSKVSATRRPVDLETSYPKAKRIILRDVLRTDRNFHYFSHKRNLRKVHRILMVYAMFYPDIGYAQGMNDILARFLVVTDSEVDSYFMFTNYMEGKKADFLEDSMMKKVALVKSLIEEVDQELYQFFEASECKDYLFCHRWLLLDFKREFEFEDSIRIFELLGTHYLELNSDKALLETDKAIAKEFLLDGGEMRPGRALMNLDFTFGLFVCVAILVMHRSEICKATDAASVYGCLNGLSMNMNLSDVLAQAEQIFYEYCRLSITRGFNEINI